MTTIRIQTGVRYVTERGLGEYEPDVEREVPFVEVVIGGRSFTAECSSSDRARELVVRTAQDLGLELPCTCVGCVSPTLACTCHGSAEVKLERREPVRMWCSECGCTTMHAGGCDKGPGAIEQRKPSIAQRRNAHGMPPIPADQRAANLAEHLETAFHTRAAELEPVLDEIRDAARAAVDRGVRAVTIPEIERDLASPNPRYDIASLLDELPARVFTAEGLELLAQYRRDYGLVNVDTLIQIANAHTPPLATNLDGTPVPTEDDTEPPCPACTARGECFDRCPNAGNERPYIGPHATVDERGCEDVCAGFHASDCQPAATLDQRLGQSDHFAPYPTDRPPRYNGGTLCDMWVGPCACGAWHKGEA